VALNKADRLDAADRSDRLAAAQSHGWRAVLVSATDREGLDELRAALHEAASGAREYPVRNDSLSEDDQVP
jgi:50S ribosomal subunit-associated GTPase HflX